ncbi:hypothetical protein FGADI_7101 [Fusarium gaditjirri]|uniref:Uncharacterized protein n=1 Tax=Fusarium gaditjirri TaxID=282569 RepID=A0A8H4T5Z2_9HYPO|nr:hypothetical protein FGADI_7101 [Fusarium gaditjirri]
MASAQEAEQIIQSLNGHGTLLGKHVQLSAKRLLYELLRYTNGKPFFKASAANESPFINFRIYPDRIVIDCNNGDLTKADVEAICQPVNKEHMKGANFKTIIAATKRAHIQSGNFSFEFQHNIFDVDSDMMRPTWVTSAESIPDNFTRITLYLHDQGGKEDIQNLRKVIISQFESLEEECLLFLKDPQSMRIEFFGKGGNMYQFKYFRKHTVDEYRVSLRVTTVEEGKEKTHTQLYHLIEQSADDLTPNVMLAFPLTDDFKVQADTKAKKLFSFTPLQRSPLGFHIHSDFELKDDQYSVVTTSAYNLTIRDQVATAFFQAILQFCEHPTLRYHWPLFLTPKVRDSDYFWSGLDTDIRSWVAQNPVLISRGIKHWRLISHLDILIADAQDKAGRPLLDDPINDPFLSSKYPLEVVNTLKEYGLATLNNTQFLKLLELHFHNPKLRLATLCRTKEWYVALSRLLSKLFVDEEQSERIKSLPLLQLRDGSLASAASAPVYFPTTGNIDIPENLNLRVVSGYATSGHYPRALFQQLGVLQATVVQPYHAVKIMTLKMTMEMPWRSIVYLPGMDHPYTPQKLMGLGRSLNLQDTWVPLKELKDCVKQYMEYPDKFPFLKLEKEEHMDLAIGTKWSFLTKHFSVKGKNDMDFLLEILESIKHSCNQLSPWQTGKVIELYTAIGARFLKSIGDERERALEFFGNSGILYIDETGPTWTGLSSCLWTAPADMVSAYSLRSFYEERIHDKQEMESLDNMFHVEMGIRDATVEDLVKELLLLRNEGCEDITRVTDIYNYLDKEITASPEMRIAFDECGVIFVKRDAFSMWLSASECFWSEAGTTQLNSSLKACYPNLKEFFLGKLAINVSAYDKLLDPSSTSLTDTKRNMLSLMDETNGLVPEFPAEPIRKAKVFPVRHPYEPGQPFRRDELCSVDTEFAIGDRESLKRLLYTKVKMLNFDLIEVRRLQPFFRWLSIEDRYLSRCVKEKLDCVSTYQSRRWDLRTKAYHIARVGATFNSYGSCDDALSLYKRLRTVQIVEVIYISTRLEIVQDGQTIQSDLSYGASAHIHDCDDQLIIYVMRDSKNQQQCFFSVLPRKLQEWLTESSCRSPNGTQFEVVNALTSIFASDVSVLDGILEDQGIVEVPFENQAAVERKYKIKLDGIAWNIHFENTLEAFITLGSNTNTFPLLDLLESHPIAEGCIGYVNYGTGDDGSDDEGGMSGTGMDCGGSGLFADCVASQPAPVFDPTSKKKMGKKTDNKSTKHKGTAQSKSSSNDKKATSNKKPKTSTASKKPTNTKIRKPTKTSSVIIATAKNSKATQTANKKLSQAKASTTSMKPSPACTLPRLSPTQRPLCVQFAREMWQRLVSPPGPSTVQTLL